MGDTTRNTRAGGAFVAMGVAFIALGISTNRTFLFVGIVFLIIGSARIARSRGSH